MTRVLAASVILLSLLLVGASRAEAENLPVAVDRYAKACAKTGGAVNRALNSGGTGTLYCQWNAHGRTECKVGSNQVNVCAIRCRSDACLIANPERHLPVWPLSGGPGRKNAAPMDTLMPDTLAPVN